MKQGDAIALILVAAACLGGCASPPEPEAATASLGAAAALAPADMQFARAAAASGRFELEASRLAAGKSTAPAVRAFAQGLVRAHASANEQLVAVLHRRGIAPPAALPRHLQTQLQRLSGLSGASFDNAYVRMVGLQAHQRDIAAFERALPALSDRELRAWAASQLPLLRGHLRAAQDVAGLLAG